MGDVLTAVLQKEQSVLVELGNAQDSARLRLAAQGASLAVFDWDVAAGAITWDGTTEILPFQRDIHRATTFLSAIDRERRAALEAVIDTRTHETTSFSIEIEIASAMGAVTFAMVGSRIPGMGGQTERLVGVLR